ncbi:hypothetical protein [Hymenobacter sp. YC55]|uniref:hypothetical protein n=1 Tax=Hymenobacter sp. YC55 TaxID=3034019 RepID=UPI0023F8D96B|nr:hypothetical protein [Hymenobacter sp. YC55]MDF7813219.1 hypothetical protein [Hymenobacter sp. YC55]
MKPENSGQLRVAVQGFLFSKDNEYFNKINEGKTLYGTQLAPRLVYFPSGNLRLEAGIFLYKDYGTPRLRQVRPLFTAKYQNGPHSLLFGNIEGQLNHGYIEPLFDFERVMLNRLEEGMQYRLQTSRVQLDAWVDWQRQQYRYSNFQEEVAGGLTSEVTAYQDSAGWRLGIVPMQFLAIHHGGQLDTIDTPLQTLFNFATGLRVRRKLNSKFATAVYLDGYVTHFTDYSFEEVLPYKRGTGLYLNASVDTRLSTVMVSYWSGNGFVAPQGGKLYQSISSTVNNPNYTERQRQLLILRFLKDYHLPGNVTLSTRFEPFYDLQNKQIEFSFGAYLNFNYEFLLGTLRQSE